MALEGSGLSLWSWLPFSFWPSLKASCSPSKHPRWPSHRTRLPSNLWLSATVPKYPDPRRRSSARSAQSKEKWRWQGNTGRLVGNRGRLEGHRGHQGKGPYQGLRPQVTIIVSSILCSRQWMISMPPPTPLEGQACTPRPLTNARGGARDREERRTANDKAIL